MHEILHYDLLTGLANQRFLVDRLSRAMARATRYRNRLLAVLFLDLDPLWALDEGIGLSSGNGALQEAGRRIQRCIRNVDTAACMREDRFAVLLDEIREPVDVVHAVARIQKELAQPIELCGKQMGLTACIGIVLGPANYRDAEEMIRDAEVAARQAKRQGPGRCVIFDTNIQKQVEERARLEERLGGAIEREELRLHYQPIVSLATGEFEGFEALLRWQLSEQELLYPSDFLPVAEAADLMTPINNWVLQESCRQLARWQHRFPSHRNLNISVNLPIGYLEQPDFPRILRSLIHDNGIEPSALTLEILESQIMEHPEFVAVVFSQLNEMGVAIALDDFGKGYSSLSYLGQLPFQILKIDQSFVAKLGICARTQSIVRAICLLGECLGLRLIAEGVETQDQLRRLRALGCTHCQGFYFARPLEPHFAERLIAHAGRLDHSLL